MGGSIDTLARIAASLFPLVLFVVPGYWLVKYARTRRLHHLKGAVAGTFAFHLLWKVQTPVIAYPNATYVWEYAPGRNPVADAIFVQFALLLMATGAVLYGLRRSAPRLLGATAVVLAGFTFGVPLRFWYWAVFPLEIVLILFYAFRVTGHPTVASHAAVVRAGIWLTGSLLAILAFVSVHRDSTLHVIFLLVVLAASYVWFRVEHVAPRPVRDRLLGR